MELWRVPGDGMSRTARLVGLIAPFAPPLHARGALSAVPTLPDWAVQVFQVVTILVLAPLVGGIIAGPEAVVQQRRGPRVLQPYYDIFKLLRKETVLPAPAGAGFRAAAYVSFAAFATIPLVIPALADFSL